MEGEGLRVEMLDGEQGARLSGELDLASFDEATSRLGPLFEAQGDVVIDLSGVSFIDSSGIRLLIRVHQADHGGGGLIVRSAQPQVARVLRIAGLDDLGVRFEGAAE